MSNTIFYVIYLIENSDFCCFPLSCADAGGQMCSFTVYCQTVVLVLNKTPSSDTPHVVGTLPSLAPDTESD